METDHTEYQYVNLGDLSEACITKLLTCGSDGGTVALWLKVEDCVSNGGAISTSNYFYDSLNGPYPSQGFVASCSPTTMRYTLADTISFIFIFLPQISFSFQPIRSTSRNFRRASPTPPGSKFFQFRAGFGKFWRYHMLAPPPGR